ncbi:methyltransferase [Spirochaetia bacterium]|nr:methyltransferase [Spirochaetia bacterium]
MMGTVYQAVPGFEDHLEHELGTWQEQWGPLYYADQHNAPVFWQQNSWLEPFRLEFDSISQAVSALRGIQRNWAPPSMPLAPVLHTQFRRAALIESQLPPISRKPRPFPWQIPDAGIGAWTLLDAHTLIASPRCSSPFPAGVIEFEEDKIGPPSRAYLKLWEALVRCGKWPQPGQKCLDAGASPGGWTWALARLGAEVTAVDRAPLEDRILAMPGVTAFRHDAFTLTPEDLGPTDWVFSDVICYPPRLYEWIQKWLASGLCKNFVCTIKMQGEPDYETTQAFAEIPGSAVTHLYHNKHELTWVKVTEE